MKTRVIQSELDRPIPSGNGRSRPGQSDAGVAGYIRRHALVVFFVLAFAPRG